MNANEYINGMADLLRTTGAEYVKVEDVNARSASLLSSTMSMS